MEKKNAVKKMKKTVKKLTKNTIKKNDAKKVVKTVKKVTKKRTVEEVQKELRDIAVPSDAVPCEGKTINFKGTAKIVTKMAQYGRDTHRKHQILEDARHIQPIPDGMRRDSKAGDYCACPICTLKPEHKTRPARVIAAIRHALVWLRDCVDPSKF